MSTGLSQRIRDTVWQALTADGAGSTPASVHSDVEAEGIARITVRHALRDLVREGRARFEGPECQRRYWRTD